MSTEDDYGQDVSIAALTDAPNAEALARAIANGAVSRGVLRFASSAARTAALTGDAAPVEGMMSTLNDTNRVYRYSGSAWEPVAALVQRGTLDISFSTLDQYSGTDVTFPAAFPTAPTVTVNIMSGVGSTARWNARAIDVTTAGFTPFVFSGEDGANSTWVDVQVDWIAVAS